MSSLVNAHDVGSSSASALEISAENSAPTGEEDQWRVKEASANTTPPALEMAAQTSQGSSAALPQSPPGPEQAASRRWKTSNWQWVSSFSRTMPTALSETATPLISPCPRTGTGPSSGRFYGRGKLGGSSSTRSLKRSTGTMSSERSSLPQHWRGMPLEALLDIQ